MTVSGRYSNLGRHLFGMATLAFGIITLIWPDYKNWDQMRLVLNAADGPVFLYVVAAAQVFGGIALQFRRFAKAGAIALGVVYLVFALFCVPRIATAPLIYDRWGNFFEQFSLATGAAIVYARASSAWSAEAIRRVGAILVGICTLSFALEQAFYLDNTAVLVPKWLPPNQMFWAIATTVAFVLAAIALLTDRLALRAARLLTLMLVIFGLLVWVPILFSNPVSHANWSETAETFAIAGTTWILVDLLREQRRNDRRPR